MESQSSATVREGSNHSGDYIREESDRVVSTGGYMVGMDPRVPPLQHTVRHFMPCCLSVLSSLGSRTIRVFLILVLFLFDKKENCCFIRSKDLNNMHISILPIVKAFEALQANFLEEGGPTARINTP